LSPNRLGRFKDQADPLTAASRAVPGGRSTFAATIAIVNSNVCHGVL